PDDSSRQAPRKMSSHPGFSVRFTEWKPASPPIPTPENPRFSSACLLPVASNRQAPGPHPRFTNPSRHEPDVTQGALMTIATSNATSGTSGSSETLTQRWAALRSEQPRVRIRDAAATLGVSEAELLATTVDGRSVVRLAPRFRELLKDVPALGKVMALTRNNDAVHERKGVYEDVSTGGHAGLVVGPDIDLRLFFSDWTHGFALADTGTDD